MNVRFTNNFHQINTFCKAISQLMVFDSFYIQRRIRIPKNEELLLVLDFFNERFYLVGTETLNSDMPKR